MQTENAIKEDLSLAYIMAISAVRGFTVEFNRKDNDSIDATIRHDGYLLDKDSSYSSPLIHIQLKATSTHQISDNHITYALPIKNYNDLRAKSVNPKLLIVLLLPEEKSEWLTHSIEDLKLKRCAYYLNLAEAPEKANTTSVTVKIPSTNVFSPESIHELMLKASKQESL